MKVKFTVTIICVAAFSVFTFIGGCGKKEQTSFSDVLTSETSSTEGLKSSEPEETVGEIFVYVCGAVQSPGVYGFMNEARVCDAIAAAEGFTDDAVRDYLNQAEPIYDGEKVYVPTVEEVEQGYVSEKNIGTSGVTSDGKVNINFASSEELQMIVGIGETRALAIIEYREKNGVFSSIDEITKVSGIGESTYQKIKDSICV